MILQHCLHAAVTVSAVTVITYKVLMQLATTVCLSLLWCQTRLISGVWGMTLLILV